MNKSRFHVSAPERPVTYWVIQPRDRQVFNLFLMCNCRFSVCVSPPPRVDRQAPARRSVGITSCAEFREVEQSVKEARKRFAALITFRKSNKNLTVLQHVLKVLPSWPNALSTTAEDVVWSSSVEVANSQVTYQNNKINYICTQLNTTMYLLHWWLPVSAITTISTSKGWLHVVHKNVKLCGILFTSMLI